MITQVRVRVRESVFNLLGGARFVLLHARTQCDLTSTNALLVWDDSRTAVAAAGRLGSNPAGESSFSGFEYSVHLTDLDSLQTATAMSKVRVET